MCIVVKNSIRLRVYPGGIIGDERDMVRKMRLGQIQAAAITTEGLSEIVPEFSAYFVPLAILIASSSFSKGITVKTGPKTSSHAKL